MAREKTFEEVREQFLRTAISIADYWSKVEGKTDIEKCRGTVFSIMALLDGSNASMPGFIVAPLPHKDDKDYRKSMGQNWFPENHDSAVNCDIAGGLHEVMHKYE